jgi:hypothetical protein
MLCEGALLYQKGMLTMTTHTETKQLFLRDATALEHLEAQREHYSEYTGTLLLLLQRNVALSHATKSRILAAYWARRDFEVAHFLMDQEAWSIPELVKALNILDAGRQIRALETRITRLETQGTASAATLGQLRSTIQDLQKEPLIGSLSGALAKRIKRWFRTLTPEALTFYALVMPPEPWRDIADMLHIKPDDFQVDWFLPVMFGATPPTGSAVAACLQATERDIPELIATWKAPYSFLRRQFTMPLPEEHRGSIGTYETLYTLLWYYEELACPAIDKHIQERLEAGETPGFGYAMMVERMLVFEKLKAPFYGQLKQMAADQLDALELPLESPVVVLGDASSSMDVAIRVSTIIGSLLASVTGAKLRFFNHQLMVWNGHSTWSPKGLDDMMEMVKQVRASGMTSPAAGLWPSLRDKEIVRHFIIVTDEEENKVAEADGQSTYQLNFAPLLERYREEVYPAKVTFISFLRNPQTPGYMTPQLETLGIPTLRFVMNGQRPDLTKIDALLGLLASESAFFQEQASLLAKDIEQKGVAQVIQDVNENTPGDEDEILHAQLHILRDLAFAHSQDRQAILQSVGKLRHFAQLAGYETLAEQLKPTLATLVDEDSQLHGRFFRDLLRQLETIEWNIT